MIIGSPAEGERLSRSLSEVKICTMYRSVEIKNTLKYVSILFPSAQKRTRHGKEKKRRAIEKTWKQREYEIHPSISRRSRVVPFCPVQSL
jgi:hypothetical protein